MRLRPVSATMGVQRLLASCLAVSCGLFLVTACEAQNRGPLEIAQAYLHTITNKDWKTLRSSLTSDARYIDRTFTYFRRPALDLEGANAIAEFWREASQESNAIGIEIRHSIVAGSSVVLLLDVTTSSHGAPWGYPGHQLEAGFSTLTHLRLHDAKIQLHEDLADYQSAGDQFAEQSKALKARGLAAADAPDLSSQNKVAAAEIWQVADLYLGAIHAHKWNTMVTFLDSRAQYLDPTMATFERGAVDLQGAAEIVEFWRRESEGARVLKHSYEVEHRFVAGDTAVVVRRETLTTPGTTWGRKEAEITVSFLRMIALDIRDGKVHRHTDFVDYPDIMAQASKEPASMN